jgi:hypothetical protein
LTRFWWAGFIAILFASACSGKDPGPPFPDTASFCAGRAKAECTAEVLISCALSSVDRCISGRAAACTAELPAGAVYAPNPAEACLNQVASVYEDARVTQPERGALVAACQPVFGGAGVSGASCARDEDCVLSAGLRCARRAATAEGTCQVPKIVQGGGSCAPADAVCAPGFHCGTSAHCDVNAAVGEACTAALPCAPEALCSGAGTCQLKAEDGSACASDDACLNGICARAAGSTEGLCVKELRLATNEPFCQDARAQQ